MARRMTSEIIAALQKAVEKHGDLPFELCDADNSVTYGDVTVFANTVQNGGADDEEGQAIGLQF